MAPLEQHLSIIEQNDPLRGSDHTVLDHFRPRSRGVLAYLWHGTKLLGPLGHAE